MFYMPRKKIEDIEKCIKFGITIHPELAKFVKEKSKNDKISVSKIIENLLIKHFKKESK